MTHRPAASARLFVAATLVIHAAAAWASGPATSFAILPGYFHSDSMYSEYNREKPGSFGMALTADLEVRQTASIGLLIQYGQFIVTELVFGFPDGRTAERFGGATGNMWLVAPTIRMHRSQGFARPFIVVGAGWVHSTLGPEEYAFRWADGQEGQFALPPKQEDNFALVGQVGVDFGPPQETYAGVLAIGVAGWNPETGDNLGSAYWTVQLGLRLRFGGP